MTDIDLLGRTLWQPILHAEHPRRLQLLKLSPTWPLLPLQIRVHRNHSFEMVSGCLAPYLAYAGYEAAFFYSDYDDSLNFNLKDDPTDNLEDGKPAVELLWLDLSRYNAAAVEAWLAERANVLRSMTENPILIVTMQDCNLPDIPGVFLANLTELADALAETFLDESRVELSGTRLSNQACVETARLLGAHWLPALVRPAIKAVVLDLDNTLYDGVLGEDGIDGIRITREHRTLQRALKKLASGGCFLAVCSKNEESDVTGGLFNHPDMELALSDLAAHRISWQPKSTAIGEIADELRISVNDMLFIDDNPGELLDALTVHPHLNVIHASEPENTHASLRYFPNLFRWRTSAVDELRLKDQQSHGERDRLREAATTVEDYLRKLCIKLQFTQDDADTLPRVSELSGKTNQFNTAFARLSEADVAKAMQSDSATVVTCSLQDRLTDSGMIALVVASLTDNGDMRVDDICVSCRALGRNIENTILMQSLQLAKSRLGANSIRLVFKEGPRNQPARDWVKSVSGVNVIDEGEIEIPLSEPPYLSDLEVLLPA